MMSSPIVIVVHGGAWSIPDGEVGDCISGTRAAAAAGYAVLAKGGSALDAVEAAVRVLEDLPVFDAGTGSVLNAKGDVECDALIVDGNSLRSGGVIGVNCTRHPISVARAVMDKTPHALFAGEGARAFALANAPKEDLCNPDELVTDAARAEFASKRNYTDSVAKSFRNEAPSSSSPSSSTSYRADTGVHDTVGAVALDCHGAIAAGTSTGGITLKLPGRVGDSPLIGSGAYADSALGGASTTGHGESIMRVLLAHRAVQGLKPGGRRDDDSPLRELATHEAQGDDDNEKHSVAMPISDVNQPQALMSVALRQRQFTKADTVAQRSADDAIVHMLQRVDGYGGVIVVSRDGGIGVSHSTKRMAWASARGEVQHVHKR